MVSTLSLKIYKKLKNTIFKTQNIRFWAQGSLKIILKEDSYDQILI